MELLGVYMVVRNMIIKRIQYEKKEVKREKVLII